jgi:hypothetical protein
MYVHQYKNPLTQNIYTEEVYWVPGNVANFGAAVGLLVAAHQVAYLFDNVLWGQIRGAIVGVLGALAPLAFPTGLPVPSQAAFTLAWANLQAEAVPAAPVVGRRRSYNGLTVRNSALYAFLRLINSTVPVGGPPTQWHTLRNLAGRIRILDFTGESQGGHAAVVDAKFSYGATFDNFGPGQAADQLTIHQSLANGPGAAAGVPAVTWHLCACNQELLKQMQFERQTKKIKQASGKRNEQDRVKRARYEYEQDQKRTKFVSSADVAWVKG